MANPNDSSSPHIVKFTDRPPESLQLLDASNQPMTETREKKDFSNREYPWLKKSIFLLVLLCALLLVGVVILALALHFGQDAQSNSRDKILFYYPYSNNVENERRIGLFNSFTRSVEEIATFHTWYWPNEVATTQNKIFAIRSYDKRFEIFDLNTREITRGPDPPEWRDDASVAYFKDKLYYLGGKDLKTHKKTKKSDMRTYQYTNRVDILINGIWQTGPAFPLPTYYVQAITSNGSLYVIDGDGNNKIYRLSDNEREWIEVGEIPERRHSFGIASLNGRIYITGGEWNDDVFKSCLLFDPSAPVGSRISRIADMNYAREDHSLIVANGKLYAIGGFQQFGGEDFCNSIEEYDPQANKWTIVGKVATESLRQSSMADVPIQHDQHSLQSTEDMNKQKFDNSSKIDQNTPSSSRDKTLFYYSYPNNDEDEDEDEGRIGLFNSDNFSIEKIANFHNYYWPYGVAATQNKIFGINSENKSFEIFDLNTRQISRGPDPPEWRGGASVAYFKDKLYYLGGEDPKTGEDTNRVDVLIDGKWETGPTFPSPISEAQTIICDQTLYIIDGLDSKKIYRLSDDEREWIEVGEIPERRGSLGVASLNGKIYITGGVSHPNVLKSCLCFDPSAPVGSRISRIADMNYARYHHSLIVANGKLYAIGGFQQARYKNFCDSIEEYDPQTNRWREVGKFA